MTLDEMRATAKWAAKKRREVEVARDDLVCGLDTMIAELSRLETVYGLPWTMHGAAMFGSMPEAATAAVDGEEGEE